MDGRSPTFDATAVPVSRLKGQSTRSPCTLMLTNIVCHIFQTARPTNFKLGIQMQDEYLHQPRAPWPSRSRVKVIPGPLMMSHIVRHIFRMTRPTNFNLVYGWKTTSHRCHDLQGQRSRSQGHAISLSYLGPMLYLCH